MKLNLRKMYQKQDADIFFSILNKQNHHEIISYWIKRHVQPEEHFGPVVNLKSLNSMTILEGQSVAE